MTDLNSKIAEELKLGKNHVEAAVSLLKEGAPALFVAHYRKERTGGMDEAKLRAIQERLGVLSEMEQRRATAIKAISEAGKMTPELQASLESVADRAELEDLYMAFRSRRRVRSSAAKAKGLDALADIILKQHQPAAVASTPAPASATEAAPAMPAPAAEGTVVAAEPAPVVAAVVPGANAEEIVKPFINAEKGVKDMAEALAGARDIVAERLAEDAPSRKLVRHLLLSEGKVTTKAREGIDLSKGKYAAFAQFSEPVGRISLQKLLSAMRGAAEKQLALVIEAPREKILQQLKDKWMTNPEALLKPELALAIEECFDRLLGPALDNELRQDLKRRVDLETATVCARNLRALLMQAPFGNKPVLAIEPAQNAACKAAVLDGAGQFVASAVLAIEKGDEERKAAAEKMVALIKEHNLQAVAIGSGAGSREADLFVRDALKTAELKDVFVVVIHLHGAIQTAREDMAGIDAAVRGAVLIGRRLQDPLLELARIDPATLNLSQHQHEADAALLKEKLDEVLEGCVSAVGGNVNSATPAILRYIAGVGPSQAGPVVDAGKAKGGFKTREDLRDLPGCGPRMFEYSAGFLRVKDGANPLDNTAIHPEHYTLVESMAASLNSTVKDLLGNAEQVGKIELAKFTSDTVGETTLKDILEALKNFGKDVRGEFVKPETNPDVRELKDLKEGMILTGVVTNLTVFGAFVDVGVHQDGLVHISALTHKFIRDASEAVTIGQRVKVKVLSVDGDKKRISLSMKELEAAPKREPRRSSASSEPRQAGARPPRTPRPPRPVGQGAPAAAGSSPAGAAAGTASSRPPRRDFKPRDRAPRPAPIGAPGSTPASAGAPASASGAPSAGPRRFRDKRERAPGGDSRGERTPRPEPVAPGKPDYSKFFVKGKRQDKDKGKRKERFPDGASRDEVRQVMRQEESGGNTLADLLRKAGVGTDDGK